MISLNIISQELKQEIKISKIYKSLKNLFFVLLLNLFLYTFFLVFMLLMLQIKHSEVLSEASNTNRNIELYSKKAEIINTQINEITEIQNSFVSWSSFLSNFTNETNDGIIIYKIYANKTDNSLLISGKARERNDLLNFKNKLSEISYIENFELPIKNLLEKNDISFEIKTKFINYEF